MPISNGTLAQKISDLLDRWTLRENEFITWLSGTATGGANSDGQYPLTDVQGVAVLVKSPARMQADADGVVNSASGFADDADASAAAAATSATNAATSKTQADAARDAAIAARDLAESYKNQAGNSAASASTQATNAASSASAAAASAAAADASADAADASAIAADASADAAAASAAAAAASAGLVPAPSAGIALRLIRVNAGGTAYESRTPAQVLSDIGAAAASHSHAAADITSGTLDIARVPTGTSGTTVALGNHNHDAAYAALAHTHSGADITSGTVAFARLPTGTSGSTVAIGNHVHAAADITSGTLAVARGGLNLALAAGDALKFLRANSGGTGYEFRTAAQVLSDIGAAASSHTHTTADITNLSSYTGLDGRYYTEAEVDSALAGKAAASHTHAAADVTSGVLDIARVPTGTTGTTVALGNHNHDAAYAALGHNHDASYAAIGHNHNASYAALSHTHAASDVTSGVFSTARLGTGTANSSKVLYGDGTWGDAPTGGGGGGGEFDYGLITDTTSTAPDYGTIA